jgi:hypothetical protein
MANFSAGFKRKAVVIVPTEEDAKVREEKKIQEEGKDVLDSIVLQMKADFQIPSVDGTFSEVEFPELALEEALKVITFRRHYVISFFACVLLRSSHIAFLGRLSIAILRLLTHHNSWRILLFSPHPRSLHRSVFVAHSGSRPEKHNASVLVNRGDLRNFAC